MPQYKPVHPHLIDPGPIVMTTEPRPMGRTNAEMRRETVEKTGGEPLLDYEGAANPYIDYQSIDLLLSLQRDRGMALILITHDLGLVAEVTQRVMVMYAGQMVETGRVPGLFEHPQHPYTAALLSALPGQAHGQDRLQTIPGVVPGKYDRPSGCLLSPRCKFANELCRTTPPQLRGDPEDQVRCHTPLDASGNPT